MIKVFNNYYDKNGKRFKVISFTDGVYLCEYSNNKRIYLSRKDIFLKKPKEKNDKIITPVYFKERMVSKETNRINKSKEIEKELDKENIKELEEDFYRDL